MYNTRTLIILPFTKYSVILNWKENQLIQALPLYSHTLLCVMGFDSAIASCCLICLVLPTIVLQTCGVFSSSWIKHNTTSECYRGVISTTGCPHGVKSNAKCLKKNVFFFMKPCWHLIKCCKQLNAFDLFTFSILQVLVIPFLDFRWPRLQSSAWQPHLPYGLFAVNTMTTKTILKVACYLVDAWFVYIQSQVLFITRMISSFNKMRFHYGLFWCHEYTCILIDVVLCLHTPANSCSSF